MLTVQLLDVPSDFQRTTACFNREWDTFANGEKPMPSRFALLPKLMNICVVRELGPDVANDTYPRLLLSFTGSSFSFFSLSNGHDSRCRVLVRVGESIRNWQTLLRSP